MVLTMFICMLFACAFVGCFCYYIGRNEGAKVGTPSASHNRESTQLKCALCGSMVSSNFRERFIVDKILKAADDISAVLCDQEIMWLDSKRSAVVKILKQLVEEKFTSTHSQSTPCCKVCGNKFDMCSSCYSESNPID
jgi:hypothetical protein